MTQGHKKFILFGLLIAALMIGLIVFSALKRGQQGTNILTVAEYVAEMELKLAALQETVAANPKDIRARNALGDMLYYLERFAEAEQVWLESLTMDDNQPMVWSIVGEARIKQSQQPGFPPEAVAAFAEALRRDPHDDRARFYMAMHDANNGRFDEALLVLREISAAAPPESMSKTAAERGILEIEGKRGR